MYQEQLRQLTKVLKKSNNESVLMKYSVLIVSIFICTYSVNLTAASGKKSLPIAIPGNTANKRFDHDPSLGICCYSRSTPPQSQISTPNTTPIGTAGSTPIQTPISSTTAVIIARLDSVNI